MITVTLKTGKDIRVLPRELKGLKAAGLLKEEKGKTKTKEEKGKTETKLDAEDAKPENEETKQNTEEKTDDNQGEPEKKEEPALPKNRPVNISTKNINQGTTR
jgi:hypothetical protein